MGRAKAWMISATLLIVVIAVWSRLSTMKETPKIIRAAGDAVSGVFRGVLK